MRQHIFLDLEQTVIDCWGSNCLINIDRVSREIREFESLGPIVMHIFSFAVWNDTDVATFRKDIEPRLAEALGLSTKFIVHTVDEMSSIFLKHTATKWERNELITCLGKQLAFMQFCRSFIRNQAHCILLDDVVCNSVTVDTDSNLIIQTMKI